MVWQVGHRGCTEISPFMGQDLIVKSQILVVHITRVLKKEEGSMTLNVVTRVQEMTPQVTSHTHVGSQTAQSPSISDGVCVSQDDPN